MRTIDPMHDYETCGGPLRCPNCSDILDETFEKTHARLTAEDRARGILRTASDGSWQLRTNVHLWEDGPMDNDYTDTPRTTSAPDPYVDGIAKLRAAQGIEIKEIADDDPRLSAMAEFRDAYCATVMASRFAAMAPATSDVYANPPDGYSIALAQRKETLR